MALEDTLSQTETTMKESLLKEWGLEKEFISGSMEAITRENGRLTKWMEEDAIEVWMEWLHKESLKMTI